MKTLEFLKSNINTNLTLLSIVDTFGRMCRIDDNLKDELFLFEAGTQVCNGHNAFILSMVKQFDCGGDEPAQLHLDISYRLTDENKNISECSWHENYGDMIQSALLSKAFEICKNSNIVGIDIWQDKT